MYRPAEIDMYDARRAVEEWVENHADSGVPPDHFAEFDALLDELMYWAQDVGERRATQDY